MESGQRVGDVLHWCFVAIILLSTLNLDSDQSNNIHKLFLQSTITLRVIKRLWLLSHSEKGFCGRPPAAGLGRKNFLDSDIAKQSSPPFSELRPPREPMTICRISVLRLTRIISTRPLHARHWTSWLTHWRDLDDRQRQQIRAQIPGKTVAEAEAIRIARSEIWEEEPGGTSSFLFV